MKLLSIVLVCAAALAAGCASAQPAAEAPAPAARMAPPSEQGQRPRATVTVAPYRYDDVLWENDRTAHRIYGPALEAHEPPSSSGVDAWGKSVRWPYMERQLATGEQHDDHGEGADFYNVGGSRGAGGLGIWFDNKLWTSRNYRAVRILQDGPEVARFEVDYAPWPVDVARTVWETRRFTLPLGTNFTRMDSTIRSDHPEPLVVGIGLARRPNGLAQGALLADRAKGVFSVWGPSVPGHGAMGVAILVDPAMIADVTQDADNYLVLLNVTPGRPFVYYLGAAWDGGLDFRTRAAWEAHVLAQRSDFSPRP
jgi:Domain of unknown function (DUF4861)